MMVSKRRRLGLAALTSSRFLVVDGGIGGSTGRPGVQIGHVTGTDIMMGNGRVEFGPAQVDHFLVATLDSRLFAVAFLDPTRNQMASMRDKQRGAPQWLSSIRYRLQLMVDELRSQLGALFEAGGGAASSNLPFQEGMTNMLQVIGELEDGPIDGYQEETLKRCCYDIFEEGQDVYAALEEEWYLHLETEDEDNADASIITCDELQEGRACVDDVLAIDKHVNNNNQSVQACGSNMGFVNTGARGNSGNNIDNNTTTNGNHEAEIVGACNTATPQLLRMTQI
ncbi:hypothetical protein CBR_g30554 [Chara braunii]|uniref:Uncharacterized protein n=1 Tax=Chara braunii TaxID=69332 RepID=A0A388LD13_CHABU|nr:hypothetical protein CBR_g30554 [Chara braunii]|eukprot:GBG80188.1 hypothetical protein CBR_g30554 [Chara braunii]